MYDQNYDLQFVSPLREVATHPAIFGLGVGAANGFLAVARDKRLSVRATLATSAVLAVGEAILAMDETPEQRQGRPPMLVGALSGLGVLLGLAAFTNWQQWSGGGRPVLIARGEPAPRPAAAGVPIPTTAAV